MLQLGGFDWRLNYFYAEEHPCECHPAITQLLSTSAWNSTFPQPRLALLHIILSLSTAVQPDALAPVVGLWWVSHMGHYHSLLRQQHGTMPGAIMILSTNICIDIV